MKVVKLSEKFKELIEKEKSKAQEYHKAFAWLEGKLGHKVKAFRPYTKLTFKMVGEKIDMPSHFSFDGEFFKPKMNTKAGKEIQAEYEAKFKEHLPNNLLDLMMMTAGHPEGYHMRVATDVVQGQMILKEWEGWYDEQLTKAGFEFIEV